MPRRVQVAALTRLRNVSQGDDDGGQPSSKLVVGTWIHSEFLNAANDWDPRRANTTMHPLREACRFVAASAPSAGDLWDVVPTQFYYRIDSKSMLFATQRRLGLALTCLHGVTSLSLDPPVRSCGPARRCGCQLLL